MSAENSSGIQRQRAKKEYDLAADAASTANTIAGQARVVRKEQLELEERLRNWDSIMSTVPYQILTIIFIIVCVVEYYFSREIYREMPGGHPIAYALGFIAVAVFISELLVLRLVHHKRIWKRYELRRDPNHADLLDEEMEAKVKRQADQQALFGVLLLIGMCTLLFYFSLRRVELEQQAGERVGGFGPEDIAPIVLYVVEVLTGLFVWYLLRRSYLGWKKGSLARRFRKLVTQCADITAQAVKKLKDAVHAGYDTSDMSDNLREAVFRDRLRDENEADTYVAPIPRTKRTARLILLSGGAQVDGLVTAYTEFHAVSSGGTTAGRIDLVLDTFEGDTVCRIVVQEGGVGNGEKEITGSFTLDSADPHRILL
ncbi:MAG: hypothetical protein KDC03_03000 [Flavobacteriales bacterium]|nr:hypothetical protein [Flavobacteriales bacterium]